HAHAWRFGSNGIESNPRSDSVTTLEIGDQEITMVYCTQCGTALNEGSRFCTACGTPLGSSAAPAENSAGAAPMPPVAPPPPVHTGPLQYTIQGDNLQVLRVQLKPGQEL